MKWIRLGVEKTVWKAKAEWFESMQLLPQRGKSCSVPGFALLSLRERNLARSAFHTVFSPLCLRLAI